VLASTDPRRAGRPTDAGADAPTLVLAIPNALALALPIDDKQSRGEIRLLPDRLAVPPSTGGQLRPKRSEAYSDICIRIAATFHLGAAPSYRRPGGTDGRARRRPRIAGVKATGITEALLDRVGRKGGVRQLPRVSCLGWALLVVLHGAIYARLSLSFISAACQLCRR
jgi:hypothetical protein